MHPGFGADPTCASAFDPAVVIALLKREFGDELAYDDADRSRDMLEKLEGQPDSPGRDSAIRAALLDAQRRGPVFAFWFPKTQPAVRGHVERHLIQIVSDSEIPSPLSEKLERFLKNLPLPSPEFERRE